MTPNQDESHDVVLERFLPPVSAWFRETLGSPTLPQRLAWPAIAAGQNTLIVAPTGSGKTLAAFLAALDLLWRIPRWNEGVRILYISPLKALNEDIRRNLDIPLEGILACFILIHLRSGISARAVQLHVVSRATCNQPMSNAWAM